MSTDSKKKNRRDNQMRVENYMMMKRMKKKNVKNCEE